MMMLPCRSRTVVLFFHMVSFGLGGCVTPAEEQQIKEDISGLQSRVSQIESSNSSLGKEISSQSNRQEASLNTRLDRISVEMQRIKGDIDALKIGVLTGKMPGSEESAEGSMAKTLSDLVARVETIEDAQSKILEVVDKVADGKKSDKKSKDKDKDGKEKESKDGKAGDPKEKDKEKSSEKNSEKSSESLNDFKGLKEAFQKKRYKQVVEDGPQILDSIKAKKDKQETTYMLAESLYKSGQIREAALKYNDYIDSKPKDKLPHSLLRMGDCFKELGDSETAKIYYQELIQKYSSSDEAKQAKSRLKKL